MRAANVAVLMVLGLLAAALAVFTAVAQERKAIQPKDKDNPLPELISGYYFTALKTRSMQDDDFDNPGFAWVTQGEKLWGQTDGAEQKSCSSCHANASDTMRSAGAAYPKFEPGANRVINLEQRINLCRQDQMKANPWPYASDALLSMTAYVKLQSRGMPSSVQTTGPAKDAFELGKTLYNTRAGQFGMSCANCHNDHYGDNLRAEVVSQGHANGFPAFNIKTQKLMSLHEQLRVCYSNMRAEPFQSGSAELIALELYLDWRGKGLNLEAPAVRR